LGFVHVLVAPYCFTVVVDEGDTDARRVGVAAFESVKSSRT
jgi:hypothetical protein